MRDWDLQAAAAALRRSVVVGGCGSIGREAAARVEIESDAVVRAEDDLAADLADARAAFVGVDPGDPSPAVALARRCTDADTLSVLVAATDQRPTAEARAALATLREAADAVVLSSTGDDPVAGTADGLEALVGSVAGSDDVNVDLADVETVLSAGRFAAAGAASDSDGDAVSATVAAVDACGPVSLDRATGALIRLTGGPRLSVRAAGDAVAAVRDRLAADSHLIWGATTDGPSEPVSVRVVLAGVVPVRPPASPGNPCPRCGTALVGYAMSDRESVACDDCGFADVSTPLGDDPLVPGDHDPDDSGLGP